MSFKEYKNLNLVQISNEILEYWKAHNTFEKSISTRKDSKDFVFFEGPPSANGMPGIHHVMARAIKDIFCRYKTLKGFKVERKAGWDTHGLPVELGVEKDLQISKEDIGSKISIEEYNDACKKAVMKYTDIWNELTERIGYWVDMDNPYITYKSKYIETVWWLLKKLYDDGLIYKGYSIQPYSPKAGTGLSSHELNQPGTYQDVTDTTVTAQFECVKETLPEKLKKYSQIHILAWTTTPWTLPSNTALTVGKKINYVLIKTFNLYTYKSINVILAKDLIHKVFKVNFVEVEDEDDLNFDSIKNIPYLVCENIIGDELVGVNYHQLWENAPKPAITPENAFRVISGDFVTTEDGTGVVHTAPTFGADDAIAAKNAVPEVPPMLIYNKNKELVPLVDFQGKFVDSLDEIGGKYVKNEYYSNEDVPEKSVDVEIAIKLKEQNKAFRVEKYTHSYPNCWRTDKPILYYPLNSWFVKVTEKRESLINNNSKINWKPRATGEGRFGNWLQNANDWNLSRSRFWGIPLPIWNTENGSEQKIIGSVKDLIYEIEQSIEKGFMSVNPFIGFKLEDMSDENYEKIDLHKHIVDSVILCSSKGEKMIRESDLIDVWFDSGAMPYAQWHYPFENKEFIDSRKYFPADYIAEGVDQTRGWFYTLHVIGSLIFNTNAYKNVVSNGLVLDKNGQKMSKRLGNAVDPFETLDNFGPDATRWYMISNSNPWDNLKFDISGIEEVKRKFFGTIHNIYSFFSLYANIDGFNGSEKSIPYLNRYELDRWILSELNSLIAEVESSYENYEPTKAARLISTFVQDNLSNWYIRLSRRRFWKGEYNEDKLSAYQTLHECLSKISIISSPISPFYMDNLFQDLNSEIGSVHLVDFPIYSKELIDIELENKIRLSQDICSLALSLRKKEKIKVRQPLPKILVPFKNIEEKKVLEEISEFIKSEINVKTIELITDSSEILVKKAKANFKLLGPKYGKIMKTVVGLINNLNNEQIEKLYNSINVTIVHGDKEFTLTPEDVEIYFEDIEGWLVASENGKTIALDTTIDESLKNEGMCREIVNRIQNLRKDLKYNVSDKIIIELETNNLVEKAIFENLDYVKNETLAVDLIFKQNLESKSIIEFENISIKARIYKTN
ncbi:MAG: isoleucine--tRNA ligase [Flavobacteriaceae bacterium]|nr:isoleucine--tRNA ligase [Flavobacteriaceae bacterium]|tara:strand:+ start:15353 stop:18736 length:3384 start_codon:yes stop_codon:yes gene_type:complete